MIIEPRTYQANSVDYHFDITTRMRRPISCAPTGSGKTVIQALICEEEMKRGNPVALLTPRFEIFNQSHSMLSEVCGSHNIASLRAGDEWNRSKPIHCVSWHTLTSRIKKSKAWFPDVFTVLVDEAHLSMAPRILEALEYLAPKAIIHGYTATPARATGKGLGRFYTEIKHVVSVRQLIKEGYLAPLEYWAGSAVDVKGIRIQQGDFATGELSKRSILLCGDVVDNWFRLAQDRRTLVFAVDIAHAEALTDRFLEAGVAAVCLHSKIEPSKRVEIVDKFRSGEYQLLVNVTIASYGFDVPAIDCVVLARQTKSIVLHLQCLGRGMRPHDDKSHCMILDHTDNTRNLGKADDLFRWTLDIGSNASKNWSRDADSGEAKESHTYTCDLCDHMFSGGRICPNCGWEAPLRKQDVASTDDDLVLITTARTESFGEGWPEWQTLYRMLIYYAAANDKIKKKRGWCAHKFKTLAERWPDREWEALAGIPPSSRVTAWIDKERYDYIAKQKRSGTKAAQQKRAAANSDG